MASLILSKWRHTDTLQINAALVDISAINLSTLSFNNDALVNVTLTSFDTSKLLSGQSFQLLVHRKKILLLVVLMQIILMVVLVMIHYPVLLELIILLVVLELTQLHRVLALIVLLLKLGGGSCWRRWYLSRALRQLQLLTLQLVLQVIRSLH